MNSTQITKQFREVQLDGTWIATNLKAEISSINWGQATTKIGSLNTIAALTFHLNYYIAGINQVFEGGSLTIRDKFSYDLPPIQSEADWQKLITKTLEDAERFAKYIEQLSDDQLRAGFIKTEYGNYYRNILGVIEHSYYHLGQIVIIKKLIAEGYGEKE